MYAMAVKPQSSPNEHNKEFSMPETTIFDLIDLRQYQEQRQNIFPAKQSIQWFIRIHKNKLISSGALLLIAGRYQVNRKKFDDCVLEIGAAAAHKQLELAP